ncbi:MAG: sodium:proton antiporter [Chroococcidiopsidaceae cyanobacterium CP_BM_ER_R8_30]|nr:sodium:proton antiporter [Chroococcidiopsidaceae cyanobacterium CP_BM_ER_R8_30]
MDYLLAASSVTPQSEAISLGTTQHFLFVIGIVLAVGAVISCLAQRMQLPDIVLFLLAGLLLGPEVTGIIDIPSNSALNQLILVFGSSYIIFDGGASLKLKVLKEVWITVVMLSTIGVLITATITSVAATFVMGIPYIVAFLLGTTIASTDPATLIPIFKQIKVRDRVSQTVTSESAFNDVMGSIITFTVVGIAVGTGKLSLSTTLIDLLQQLVIGILAGGFLGYFATFLIAHERYAFLAEYTPIVSLLVVIGAYLSASDLDSSGYMAVFVAGIFMGNKESFGFTIEEGEAQKLEEFIETATLIMRMFIFILLGAQVNFSLLNKYLFSGIVVVTIFMLVARPVTVFACALIDRRAKWSFQEMLFMCWTRETGVIPGAVAGILLGRRIPGADIIASVTFMAILMTILIQATTAKLLARRLGLLARE